MIVAKTPLRICFFGGGSDLPHYYEKEQGLCLSTTIDKYMYVTVCNTSIDGVKAVYNEVEVSKNTNEIRHDRIRECLKYFNIDTGVEIASFAQIPTKGTGLGSSSTFTVGLVNALRTLKNITSNRTDLAEEAFVIEYDKCNEYLGKQDQYAAAFGGFNALYFNKDNVEVSPVNLPSGTLKGLDDNLLMYYTGITRSASDILHNYKSEENNTSLRRMVSLGKDALDYLHKGKFDMFGELLDETWKEKKRLSTGVSSAALDQKYDHAIDSGALGGKILGAGGGGYFLFYVPKPNQSKFRDRMIETGMKEFAFRFSDEGSKIVCND